MEDKLITLAILTYSKAQILKNVLENEGIETYIHNVNLIQPVVSSGVRLRIKESDLPKALSITESSTWLAEGIIGEGAPQKQQKDRVILIPVDFSEYSMKACQIGFNIAANLKCRVVLLHVYYTPIYAASLPFGDVFNYQLSDEENVRNILQKVHDDLNKLSSRLKEKIELKELPDIEFSCILREGIPEEEILRYAKGHQPQLIVMGTRGKNQKEIDLIGSVTAEVIERSKTPVLVIPENTLLREFSEAKRVAFITNFDQRDLVLFDNFIRSTRKIQFSISLLHLAEDKKIKDAWDEIKLAGIKEYLYKQYPGLNIEYDIVVNDTFFNNLDSYIKEHGIDIISITSYKRSIFSRLFNPSIAKRMIFHSNTPLLVIK